MQSNPIVHVLPNKVRCTTLKNMDIWAKPLDPSINWNKQVRHRGPTKTSRICAILRIVSVPAWLTCCCEAFKHDDAHTSLLPTTKLKTIAGR